MNSKDILITELRGVRVHGSDEEVETTDYFHIGSCTKSVTAFIAGKLVDSKKISWDTLFFSIYPELSESSQIEYKNITLEDLLLCRAGIQAYTSGDEKVPVLESSLSNKRYHFCKNLLKQPPSSRYRNGKFDFFYSNASYAMAASMLEAVSGKSYEELVKLYIDKESGISTHIGFPNSITAKQPWGHMISGDKIQEFPPDHPYKLHGLLTPAGNLSMTPTDFAKFVQMNLRGLRSNGNGLKHETYKHIHFSHIGFSLGVSNGKIRGQRYSGMDGSLGTFFCRAIIVPDNDYALTIMTNAGSDKGTMKAVDWLTKKIIKK